MKKKLVSIMLVAAMALSVVACGSSKGNSAKTDGTEAMASSVSKALTLLPSHNPSIRH